MGSLMIEVCSWSLLLFPYFVLMFEEKLNHGMFLGQFCEVCGLVLWMSQIWLQVTYLNMVTSEFLSSKCGNFGPFFFFFFGCKNSLFTLLTRFFLFLIYFIFLILLPWCKISPQKNKHWLILLVYNAFSNVMKYILLHKLLGL
jgi:hypothetical protein